MNDEVDLNSAINNSTKRRHFNESPEELQEEVK